MINFRGEGKDVGILGCSPTSLKLCNVFSALENDLARIAIARVEPTAIFGTQMERPVGKRLNIPCGVIAAPSHIQDFPVGYRPFLGDEGTNQLVDLIYNSFT